MSAAEHHVLQSRTGEEDELLTVADVMALLKLSDRRAARRYMVEAGGFRLDRDYRVRASHMAKWVENREAAAYAEPSREQLHTSRDRRPRPAADWRAEITDLIR